MARLLDKWRDEELLMTGRSFVVSMITVAAVLFIAGRCTARDPAVGPLKQAVAEAKVDRAAAVETVTVYVPIAAKSKGRSDSADALVDVVSDTMLSVHITPSAPPTTVIVPPQVSNDLITLRRTVSDQARAIVALQQLVHADSVVIRRLDSLVAAQRQSRCGAKCGGMIVAGGLLLVRALVK
jgi:hypothetical protein